MKQNRRKFLLGATTAVSALAVSRIACAATQVVAVAETDPLAKALGYTTDAGKANKAKFPKYVTGQNCGNCSLYKGKPNDATGPCSVFPNKLVSADGWCNTWTKKV